MALTTTLELEDLPPSLRRGKAREIFRRLAKKAVNSAMTITRNRMVGISQHGGTGGLRQGWLIEAARVLGGRLGPVEGSVRNQTVQALVLDEGADPHFPPAGPNPPASGTPALGVWIRRVLGISDEREIRRKAFVIGRAIRRRGLPGRRSQLGKFSRLWRALQAPIAVILAEFERNYKRAMEGG